MRGRIPRTLAVDAEHLEALEAIIKTRRNGPQSWKWYRVTYADLIREAIADFIAAETARTVAAARAKPSKRSRSK